MAPLNGGNVVSIQSLSQERYDPSHVGTEHFLGHNLPPFKNRFAKYKLVSLLIEKTESRARFQTFHFRSPTWLPSSR